MKKRGPGAEGVPSVVYGQYRAGLILTPEEERGYVLRWRDLQDASAFQTLVHSCLRLVIKVVYPYRHGYELDDLVQEGNLGLIEATHRFDPDRGTRLSTYATWWIRARVLSYLLSNRGQVRLGSSQVASRVFYGLGRARRRLESMGREVTVYSLTEELGLSEEHLEVVIRATARDISLSVPVYDAEGDTYVDHLVDDSSSPEEAAMSSYDREQDRRVVQEALLQLDEREREIVQRRHLAETPATLKEVGQDMGISRERVRQLGEQAKGKLRRHLVGAAPTE